MYWVYIHVQCLTYMYKERDKTHIVLHSMYNVHVSPPHMITEQYAPECYNTHLPRVAKGKCVHSIHYRLQIHIGGWEITGGSEFHQLCLWPIMLVFCTNLVHHTVPLSELQPLMRSMVKNSILCSSLFQRSRPWPFSARGDRL